MKTATATGRPLILRGVTLLEVLVGAAATIVLLAALVPAIGRARSLAGDTVSMANLQTISLAHAMYAWDWNDRQVTWVPDDAGLYSQGASNWLSGYVSTGGCPQPLLLGFDDDPVPTYWGYFPGCGSFPGINSNGVVYMPNSFQSSSVIGAFRMLAAKAFHDYLDGRHYSEILFTPTDEKTWELVSPLLALSAEFKVVPPYGEGGMPGIIFSSYALSPSAMWNPNVLSFNTATGGWFRAPWELGFYDSYVSPTVSQCAYPDLKSRTMEHNWNTGAPAPANPAFASGYTPYFFNHGLAANPVTLYFDGHIDWLPTAQAVADDAIVLQGSEGEVGLWTRDTPLGATGYYGTQTYDGTLASHHVLTTDGILGRDVLGPAVGATRSLPGPRRSAEKSRPARGAAATSTGAGAAGSSVRPPTLAPTGMVIE